MAHSFRDADHLPHKRVNGQPADPVGLPRQRRGITPQMHGRFPDYDVLALADHWDSLTRDTVLRRVEQVPPVRFFDAEETRCARRFLDAVLAQDAEPRVPVLEMVDAKLYEGRADGYQYADMPDDREAWHLVLRGLDEAARAAGAASFADADADIVHSVIQRFCDAELSGGAWEDLNVSRAWALVMRDATGEFYSHPWAWNEMGFGGPAYPRGYMRLAVGQAGREPYEEAPAFGLDPVQDLAAENDR
jgi:hypothetical protein